MLSKPIRLRGLKSYGYTIEDIWVESKPIRLRGLKSQYIDTDKPTFLVEAYTASWIEICAPYPNQYQSDVEAYTASWIEISIVSASPLILSVEAYTASWIEICNKPPLH